MAAKKKAAKKGGARRRSKRPGNEGGWTVHPSCFSFSHPIERGDPKVKTKKATKKAAPKKTTKKK